MLAVAHNVRRLFRGVGLCVLLKYIKMVFSIDATWP